MHYRGKHRHYSGSWHCSAYGHFWLFLSVPSDSTGTIAGNRHYSSGTIEGPPLYLAFASIKPHNFAGSVPKMSGHERDFLHRSLLVDIVVAARATQCLQIPAHPIHESLEHKQQKMQIPSVLCSHLDRGYNIFCLLCSCFQLSLHHVSINLPSNSLLLPLRRAPETIQLLFL